MPLGVPPLDTLGDAPSRSGRRTGSGGNPWAGIPVGGNLPGGFTGGSGTVGGPPTTGGYGPDGTYYPGGGSSTLSGNPWAGAGSAQGQAGSSRGTPASPEPINKGLPPTPAGETSPLSNLDSIQSAPFTSALSQWLQQQGGLVQGSANAQQNSALQQLLYQQAYNGASRDHINGTYGNDLGMLNESRYRDVTLARQGLGEDRTHINNVWSQLQSDITNRRGTTDRTLEIQRWLNDRNNIWNRMNLGIQRGQLNLQNDQNRYSLQSDATARGAVNSRGHLIAQRNNFKDWRLGLQNATLGFNRENANLRASRDMDTNNYNAAVNALANQLANGREDWRHGIAGLDLQGLGIDSTARTYGYRGSQLGLDHNQALTENTYNGNTALTKYQQQIQQIQMQALMQLLGLGQTGMGLGG